MSFYVVSLEQSDGMSSRRGTHESSTHLPPDLPLTPPRSPCEAPAKLNPQVTSRTGPPSISTITPQSGLVSTYVASRRLKRKLRAAAAAAASCSRLREGVADAIGQTMAGHLFTGGATAHKQPMGLSRLELDLLANSLANGIASRLKKHLATNFVNNVGHSFGASTSTTAVPVVPLARQPVHGLHVQLSPANVPATLGELLLLLLLSHWNRCFFVDYICNHIEVSRRVENGKRRIN